MLRERLQFIPFWKLTRWGFMLGTMFGRPLRLNHGCDEYHNTSRWIIVPGIGEFVYFHKDGFQRTEEHLHGRGPEGTYGYIDPECSICTEILEEFDAP